MAKLLNEVSESMKNYNLAIDYEHEHRDAEHEHEKTTDRSRTMKPIRSIVRFSLRGMLIATIAIACGLGWWSSTARQQQRVCELLDTYPGIVQWSFEPASSWVRMLPEFVLQLQGRHLFHRVSTVTIKSKFEAYLRVPRSLQTQLPSLPYLRTLELRLIQADSVDLAWLTQCFSLKSLELQRCRYVGGEPLRLPPNLNELSIDSCEQAEQLVANVRKHRLLRELCMRWSFVSELALDRISGCSCLTKLTIDEYSQVPLKNDSLDRLKDLPSLESLSLGFSQNDFSSEAIRKLVRFSKLTSIEFPARGLDSSVIESLSVLKLNKIGFANEPTSPSFFDGLSHLRQLRTVQTSYLGHGSLRDLCEALKNVQSLEWLDHPNSELPLASIVALTDLPRFRGIMEYGEPSASDYSGKTLMRLCGKTLSATTGSTSLHAYRAFEASGLWKSTSSLQGLRRLDLGGTDIVDSDIEDIGKIETLEMLRLDNTNISTDGLESLSGLKGLKELSLVGCAPTPGLIRSLQSLTKIELGRCELSDQVLVAIADLPAISEVRLSCCGFSDVAAAAFLKSPSLSSLELELCNSTQTAMDLLHSQAFQGRFQQKNILLDSGDSVTQEPSNKTLASRPAADSNPTNDEIMEQAKLFDGYHFYHAISDDVFRGDWISEARTLSIQNQPVTDKAVDFLAMGSQLQELDLCHTEITNQGIAKLARLPELHTITLGGKFVTSEAISALGPMGGNLRSLTIQDVPLTESDLMKIKSFPRLESVSINNTGVSAELAFRCLDKPGHLDLRVDGQDFDKHDFDVYRRNGIGPSATGVCLKPFPWTTKRLETLRGHANLKSLRVVGKFDWLNILEIAATIANLEDLTIEPIGRFGKTNNDESVILPASAPYNPNLRSVYLNDMTITPAFLEWISRHKKLDSVRFYRCVFDTQDLQKLNELAGLEYLSFGECNIGDQAVGSLELPMLRSLDLDRTSVTDAVIDSILRMKKLTSIGLRAEGVSKAAALRLRQKIHRDVHLHDGN